MPVYISLANKERMAPPWLPTAALAMVICMAVGIAYYVLTRMLSHPPARPDTATRKKRVTFALHLNTIHVFPRDDDA